MTVIAWDGTNIAADRQGEAGNRRFEVSKLFPQPDGRVLAGSGAFTTVTLMVRWIANGADVESCPTPLPDLEACVIEVRPDRSASIYESGCATGFDLPVGQPHTLGVGGNFATAAMHLGKSAADACRVAIDLCPGCGIGIDSIVVGV